MTQQQINFFYDGWQEATVEAAGSRRAALLRLGKAQSLFNTGVWREIRPIRANLATKQDPRRGLCIFSSREQHLPNGIIVNKAKPDTPCLVLNMLDMEDCVLKMAIRKVVDDVNTELDHEQEELEEEEGPSAADDITKCRLDMPQLLWVKAASASNRALQSAEGDSDTSDDNDDDDETPPPAKRPRGHALKLSSESELLRRYRQRRGEYWFALSAYGIFYSSGRWQLKLALLLMTRSVDKLQRFIHEGRIRRSLPPPLKLEDKDKKEMTQYFSQLTLQPPPTPDAADCNRRPIWPPVSV